MGCVLTTLPERTLAESLEDWAEHEPNPLYARWYRARAGTIRRTGKDHPLGLSGDAVFLCGEGVTGTEACRCGHLADFLCDYPVGEGRTCDLALCGRCRVNIGPETDLCPIHALQVAAAAREGR